jgi:hypothetical protein
MDLVIEFLFFGLRVITLAMWIIAVLIIGTYILEKINNKFKGD